MKPRETLGPPSSAGREMGNARAHRIRGLPFDPHDYSVRTNLAPKLETVDSVAVLNRLKAYDTRTKSGRVYDQRIDEVQGLVDGASPPKES